jgi:hypothetical protein
MEFGLYNMVLPAAHIKRKDKDWTSNRIITFQRSGEHV